MGKFAALKTTHPILSDIFTRNWSLPLRDYAPKLFEVGQSKLEPLFLDTFESELGALGYSQSDITLAKNQLVNKPVIQTSHHITPTHGPTFFTLDLQCILGLKKEEPLLIGANSGVAFSNTAWSGALSYQNLNLDQLLTPNSALLRQTQKAQTEREMHGDDQKRISIIPSKLRDQLLFKETIPQSLVDAFPQFQESLQSLLPTPKLGAAYCPWAVQAARNIQEAIFGRRIIIFDINQLVTQYLVRLLKSDLNHPICKFLFDPKEVAKFNQNQDYPLNFLGSYKGKKSSKIEMITWDGNSLTGPKRGSKPTNLEELTNQLESGRLCPGVSLVFLVIHFFQGVKCLGSFNQIEYLDKMKHKLESTKNLPFRSPNHSGESLTTGRLLLHDQGYMPLDMALMEEKIQIADFADLTMGELWAYYKEKLEA